MIRDLLNTTHIHTHGLLFFCLTHSLCIAFAHSIFLSSIFLSPALLAWIYLVLAEQMNVTVLQ